MNYMNLYRPSRFSKSHVTVLGNRKILGRPITVYFILLKLATLTHFLTDETKSTSPLAIFIGYAQSIFQEIFTRWH